MAHRDASNVADPLSLTYPFSPQSRPPVRPRGPVSPSQGRITALGASMKIRTDEIASVIKQEIETFGAELEVSEVGRVVEVGDGIARIYGLSKAMAGELLEFQTAEGAGMGQVFNLGLDTVGAVI